MGIKMTPIVPNKHYDAAKISKAVNEAVAKSLKTGVGYFKKTTSTWKTDVTFAIDGPRGGTGAVGTDNDIYGYVTHGTRPHIIKPRNASVLSWEGGVYRAKSTPGIIGSKRGGNKPTGGVGQAVFAKVVHHPGTKARGYEEAIAKRLQSVVETNVTAAILEALG